LRNQNVRMVVKRGGKVIPGQIQAKCKCIQGKSARKNLVLDFFGVIPIEKWASQNNLKSVVIPN